jgi:PAS domain S-box-containing protein
MSSTFAFSLAIVSMAGLILGARAAFVYAGFYILSGLVMVKLAADQAIPPPFQTPLVAWLQQAAMLLIELVLLVLALRSINSAFARAWAEIESRRQAEADLRKAETRYRNLVERLPIVTYQMALGANNITYVSPQIETLLGFSSEDWLRTPDFWPTRIHAEDRQRVMASLDSGLRPDSPVENDFRMIARDGSVRWLRSQSAVFQDEAGPPYLQGFALDISARRLAEQSLRSSEGRYRTLFETAGDAIFLMQGDRFVDCNARALAMFGAGREAMIGQGLVAFSPEMQPDGCRSDEAALEKIALALSGTAQVFEWQHRRVDGTAFAVEVSLNRMDLDSGPHLLALVRDISERQQAAAENARLVHALKERIKELTALHAVARVLQEDQSTTA